MESILTTSPYLNVTVAQYINQTYSNNSSVEIKAVGNGNFHFYTSGVVGSLFVVLGIIGNILSICVLGSKRMRQGSVSVCGILLALSVYDLVFLIAHGLAGNLPHVLHHNGHRIGPALSIIFTIMYPILHIARTGSVYATVMVTIERCVAVIKPLKASIVFTSTKTNKILASIFIFSVFFNIPRCTENVLVSESGTIVVKKSAFHDTVFFHTIYLIYINFVFHFAIPFAVIAFFNALMVYTLKKVTRQYTKPSKSTLGHRNSQNGKRAHTGAGNKLSAIVLAVTSVFFLCHLVPAIALIMEQSENADRLGECSEVCSRVSSLGETLILICSATNFIIYCLFGRKFRLVFKSMFFPCLTHRSRGFLYKKSILNSMKSVTSMETNA